MESFVAAGAGFLLAVLWFDLMFDVQGRHRRNGVPSEEALASIASYYARVTTAARPMNRLVALAMLWTIAFCAVEIVDGDVDAWIAWLSAVLTTIAIALAGAHTVPAAVRLGEQRDPTSVQSRLARSILRDHVVCFVLVTIVIAAQLVSAIG